MSLSAVQIRRPWRHRGIVYRLCALGVAEGHRRLLGGVGPPSVVRSAVRGGVDVLVESGRLGGLQFGGRRLELALEPIRWHKVGRSFREWRTAADDRVLEELLHVRVLLLILAFHLNGNHGAGLLLPRNELLDLLDVVGLEGLQRIESLAIQLSAVNLVIELAVLGQGVSEFVDFSELLQLLILGEMGWFWPPWSWKRGLNLSLASACV